MGFLLSLRKVTGPQDISSVRGIDLKNACGEYMYNVRLPSTKKIQKWRTSHRPAGLDFGTSYEQLKLAVLLHNGELCNSCITKRIRNYKLSLSISQKFAKNFHILIIEQS